LAVFRANGLYVGCRTRRETAALLLLDDGPGRLSAGHKEDRFDEAGPAQRFWLRAFVERDLAEVAQGRPAEERPRPGILFPRQESQVKNGLAGGRPHWLASVGFVRHLGDFAGRQFKHEHVATAAVAVGSEGNAASVRGECRVVVIAGPESKLLGVASLD